MMILAFETRTLRMICEDNSVASNKLGPEVASALRDRVADLRAAVTKSDLIVGNPTVGGTLGELLTIDLGHEQ